MRDLSNLDEAPHGFLDVVHEHLLCYFFVQHVDSANMHFWGPGVGRVQYMTHRSLRFMLPDHKYTNNAARPSTSCFILLPTGLSLEAIAILFPFRPPASFQLLPCHTLLPPPRLCLSSSLVPRPISKTTWKPVSQLASLPANHPPGQPRSPPAQRPAESRQHQEPADFLVCIQDR